MAQFDRTLELSLYDHDQKYLGDIADPSHLEFTQRFNAKGSGNCRVDADDPVLQYLDKHPNTRYRLVMVDETLGGERLISTGRIRGDDGDLLPNGEVTLQMQDDFRLFENTLAYVNPDSPLQPTSLTELAQAVILDTGVATTSGTVFNQGGDYVTDLKRIANADDVRRIIGRIVERNLGFRRRYMFPAAGWFPSQWSTFVPPAGLFSSGVLDTPIRFGSVAEAIKPLLEWAGLGITISANGPAAPGSTTYSPYSIDGIVPRTWPTLITPESGIIVDGSYSRRHPTVTRAVVGGPGEQPARVFEEVVDTDLEARYDDVIETFRQATGAKLEWGATPDDQQVPKYYTLRGEVSADAKAALLSYLRAAGRDAIAEGPATSGLDIELVESGSFRFMPASWDDVNGFRIGDLLNIQVRGATITERVTEARIELSVDDGLAVTPTIGKRQDDPDQQLADAINAIASALKRSTTSR